MAPSKPFLHVWFPGRHWIPSLTLALAAWVLPPASPAANQPPTLANQTFDIDENAAAGTSPNPNNGVVVADDPDLPPNQLVFRILDGNQDNAFNIDPATGRLTVANPAALDHERFSVFQLTVEVVDDAGGELFSLDNAFDITPDAHDTRAVLLHDMNHDGLVDLIVGDYNRPNLLVTNTGSAGNPFDGSNVIVIGTQAGATRSAVIVDFDGNGAPDVAFANDASVNHIALNNGSMIPFDATSNSSITGDSQASTAIAAADTDANGHPDLIVGNSGARNRLYRNNGSGSPLANLAGEFADEDGLVTHAIALADFDGNGFVDLVDGASGDRLQLRPNNGAPGFNPFEFVTSSAIGSAANATRALLAADVNGDGAPDLIEGNADAQANLIYFNAGFGPGLEPFAGVEGVSFSADRHDTFALALGDLNGDGIPDLVVGNSGPAPGAINRIHLHSAPGSPFGEGIDLTSDAHQTRSLAIADINQDGALDIVVGNKDQPNRLYLNNLRSATATVTIHVNNLNEPPTALDQVFSVAENPASGTVVGTVTASDQDGDELTFTFDPEIHPAFALDAVTGVITVKDPDLIDFEQTPIVTIDAVAREVGGPTPAVTSFQIEIQVANRNEPPTITPEQDFTIDENTPNGALIGVIAFVDQDLANSPPDTHSFAITGNDSGAFELATTTGELRVRDTTQLDAEITTSFTLTITVTDSGLLSDSQTVTIFLNNLPEPPALPPGQMFAIPENAGPGALVGPGMGRVLVSPRETGVTYSFSLLGESPFAIDPDTGALTVAEPAALNYEPLAPNFFFDVLVQVADDHAPSQSSTATVRIQVEDVNEPPSLEPGQSFDIAEHLPEGSVVGMLQFSDPDLNDTPVFTSDSPAFSIDSSGVITVADSKLVDFETAMTLTPEVTLTDRNGAGLSTVQSITINLSDRNDPPEIALPSSVLLLEDTFLDIPDIVVSENGNGAAPLLVDLSVAHGSLALLSGGGLTLVDGDGSNGSLRFSGSQAALNTALAAGIRFTPSENYSGDDILTITADDQDDAGVGGRATASEELALTIVPVNDAPSANVSPLPAILEDAGPKTIPDWALVSTGPASENGQEILSFLVANVDESFFSIPPSVDLDGRLTFETAADVNGQTSFTLQVRDNGGTAHGGQDLSPPLDISVTVIAVNDAPTFTAVAPPSVKEDSGSHLLTGWIQQASVGPSDESGQALSFVVENLSDEFAFTSPPSVAPDGSLSFSLSPNANGAVTFDVVAQDNGGVENGGVNQSAPQTFSLSIVPVNDPPSAQLIALPEFTEDAGPQTIGSFAEFFPGPENESGQEVSMFVITGLTNPALFLHPPTLNNNGDLSFTPAANAHGSATFQVSVRDNGGSANGGSDTSPELPASIVILPGNDAPVIQLPATQPSGVEDRQLLLSGIQINDIDASNESLRVNLSISHGSLTPTEGTALFFPDFDGSDGTLEFVGSQFRLNQSFASGFLFTPDTDFFGVATLTISVNDLGNSGDGGPMSATATLNVAIQAENDPPISSGIPDYRIPRNALTAVIDLGASFHDAEDEDSELDFTIAQNTHPGLFANVGIDAPSAALTLVPTPNATGVARITIAATDRDAASVAASFFVHIRDTRESQLASPSPAPENWFGQGVAIHENLLAAGVWQDDQPGENAGSAHLFQRIPGARDDWTMLKAFTPPGVAPGDAFGRSVAIDGDSLAVGAVEAVHVFQRDQDGPDAWGRIARLAAAVPTEGAQFGWSVSLSGDTLMVGAMLEEVAGQPNAGAVYVFERHVPAVDEWGLTRRIVADDAAANRQFGFSIQIHGDTAIVGSPAGSAGSAYVLERNAGGQDQWGQVAKLQASGLAADAWFGRTVALEVDTIAVGAYRDAPHGEHSGSAFVFARNQDGPGAWGEVARLSAPDGAVGDFFGYSVAVSGDRVFVGSQRDDDAGSNSGSVYQFLRNQHGPDRWGLIKKLNASNAAAGAMFGFAIAAHRDTLAVGALGESSQANEAGAIYAIREGSPLEEFRMAHFPLQDLAHADKRATVWGNEADPDQDGDSNFTEFIAGLNPNDAASRFLFTVDTPPTSPTDRRLLFGPVVPGRSYSIEFSDNLGSAPFAPLEQPLTPEPDNMRSVIVAPGSTFRAYRVEIRFP